MPQLQVGAIIFCSILLFFSLEKALAFDCLTECFSAHTQATAEQITCPLLQEAMSCYQDNRHACDSHSDQDHIRYKLNSVRNGIRDRDCEPDPPDTPVAIVTSPPVIPVQCPTVTAQARDSQNIEDANIGVGSVPAQCRVSGNAAVAHCSIFMHSHLRPIKFLDDNDGIQTCSLPGAWYLFRHEDLTVEVESFAQHPPSRHTQLAKINVTIPSSRSGGCNLKTMSYIAYHNMPLANNFDGISGPHNNTQSPLQLHMTEGGTAITITATWLNITIIIRQIDGFLAASLRVAGHMAFESEGLCAAGCPNHQYIDSVSFSAALGGDCSDEHFNALIDCFAVTNLLDVTNTSYTDACTFSVLHHHSNLVRTMTEAVAMDASLLSSHLNIPRPISMAPPRPITSPTVSMATPTKPMATPTDDITTPTSPNKLVELPVSSGSKLLTNNLLILATFLTLSYQLLCIT